MAKSKKAPKASRGSRSSKPAKRPARRLPGLEKALTEMISPVSSGAGKRGRKWKGGRLEQTALDAVAAGKGRVERKPLAVAPTTRMLNDPRLPAVGSVISKTYKGRDLKVTRLEDRFEFEGRSYPSLSRIAREVIGGAQVNGFAFFGLTGKPGAEAAAPAAPSEGAQG